MYWKIWKKSISLLHTFSRIITIPSEETWNFLSAKTLNGKTLNQFIYKRRTYNLCKTTLALYQTFQRLEYTRYLSLWWAWTSTSSVNQFGVSSPFLSDISSGNPYSTCRQIPQFLLILSSHCFMKEPIVIT